MNHYKHHNQAEHTLATSEDTKYQYNKAKAISAELLELNFKNKLEDTGKTRWNGRKTETLEEKNTENRKKLNDTERNRKKQKETERNRKKQ